MKREIYKRLTALHLSSFECKVLRVVSEIPLGKTCSYKWVARKIGNEKATRAVGQVLKNNPLPLVIPCHRVIRSDGSLGGYAWGEALKKNLLEREKRLTNLE